jgi:hypothetical protein
LCSRIVPCIGSPHGNIAIAALRFVSDRRFIDHARENAGDLLPGLYEQVLNNYDSWHPEVQDRVRQLAAILKQNPDLAGKLERHEDSKAKERKEMWAMVFEAGKNADCDMTADEGS